MQRGKERENILRLLSEATPLGGLGISSLEVKSRGNDNGVIAHCTVIDR